MHNKIPLICTIQSYFIALRQSYTTNYELHKKDNRRRFVGEIVCFRRCAYKRAQIMRENRNS